MFDYLAKDEPAAAHDTWKDTKLVKKLAFDGEGDLLEIREYDSGQKVVKLVDLNPNGGVPLL